MKISWKPIIIILFFVILLGIQILYWTNPVAFADIKNVSTYTTQFIENYPITSAMLYILIYVASIVFGIPLSITIIGGYLFGSILGSLYSILGIIIGTIILCSLIRYVAQDWIQQKYKNKIESLNRELKKYGTHYILMIHITPFMPSFLPHIATSISSLSFARIIIINILGAVPLTVIYSIAGSYIHEINSLNTFLMYITILGSILALLFIIFLIYRHIVDKKIALKE